MTDKTQITEVDVAETEKNMNEDAKRLKELLTEAGQILHKNDWPGVAAVHVPVTDGATGVFGFISWNLNACEDNSDLKRVYFHLKGVDIFRAIKNFEN